MSFYKEVPGRQTTLESTLKFDTAPTAGSTNPVTSDGVNTAITEAVGGASDALQEQIDDIAEKAGSGYIPKGEADVATLNGLSGQENGWLYTVTDAGTLTDGSLAVVAGDTVAWDETNSVWYKAMDYAPRQYGTNEVHNLSTAITAFRTGDVIPVDGPSGTAKMGKDDLLNITANDALVGNVAELFDPTRTNENPYLIGEKVVYKGRIFVFIKMHYGAWSWTDVNFVMPLLRNGDNADEAVKGLALVGVIENSLVSSNGSVITYNGYNVKIYTISDDVKYLRLTARIGGSAYIGFYDEDDNLLETKVGKYTAGDSPNFVDEGVVVPVGTRVIRVSYGASSEYKCVSNLGVEPNLADIYQQNEECLVPQPPIFSLIEGVYVKPDGSMATQATYNTITYDVSFIQSFILSAKIGVASCILFMDAEWNIISYISGRNIVDAYTDNFVNEKIDIPAGAKYARIGYGHEAPFKVENYLFSERVKDIAGISKKLKGKKVAFIGDSITAGAGSSSGGDYVNQISVITGCTSVNLGVNGTCIANNTKNGLGSSRFVTRATSGNLSDADLVVVFGGTNDLSYDSKAIGDHFAETTIAASGNIGTKQLGPITDTDTFAGALHNLITTIQGVVKDGTPILFITPLHRNNNVATNPNSYQCNSNGDFMIDFVNAIKDICGFYAIPVLDLYADGEVNPLVANYSYLFGDGLHPNNKGHRVIAERIVDFVENNISFIS